MGGALGAIELVYELEALLAQQTLQYEAVLFEEAPQIA